jgi:hypothetical protein
VAAVTGIQHLIDAPAHLFDPLRDAWLASGLAARPADRDDAERGVAIAYRAAGLAPPESVVWLDSPMAGAVATWWLATRRIRRDYRGARVWNRFWDQVYAQLRERIDVRFRAHAWDQVRNQVRDQVRHEVRRRARERLREQAAAAARAASATGRVSDHAWSGIPRQVEVRVRALVQEPIRSQVQARLRDLVQAQVEQRFRDQLGAAEWQRVRPQVLISVGGQH